MTQMNIVQPNNFKLESVPGKTNNSKSRAISYENIGSVFMEKGQYPKALKNFYMALSLLEAAHGGNSPEVAECYDRIGHVYQKMEKLDDAIQAFKKALHIREMCANLDEHGMNKNEFTPMHPMPTRIESCTKPISIPFLQDEQEEKQERDYVSHVLPNDVRFERGGGGNNHPGNKQYLALVRSEKVRYQSQGMSVSEKRSIASSIFDKVTKRGGLFVTRDENDPKRYYIVSNDIVLKKVMQALRECPKEAKEKNVQAQIGSESMHTATAGLYAMAEAASKVRGSRKHAPLRGRPGRLHKPKNYVDKVTELDVLCERGGRGNNHPGNREYLDIVADIKVAYQNLSETNKKAKYTLSMAIVDKIEARGGRFLESENLPHGGKKYYILSKEDARVKVSQALRNKKN